MALLTAGSNYVSVISVYTVAADGFQSNLQMVDKGVPQGSVLGLLLFSPCTMSIFMLTRPSFMPSTVPQTFSMLQFTDLQTSY